MKKTVQYFTKDYLARCANLTPEQILEFLENYRILVASAQKKGLQEKCQPISLKIEPTLLKAFKQKAALEGIAYQTKIKELMKEWLISSSQT